MAVQCSLLLIILAQACDVVPPPPPHPCLPLLDSPFLFLRLHFLYLYRFGRRFVEGVQACLSEGALYFFSLLDGLRRAPSALLHHLRPFLDAFLHLYKRSVRSSVHPSIGWSVLNQLLSKSQYEHRKSWELHLSVHPSVKSMKGRIYYVDQTFFFVFA